MMPLDCAFLKYQEAAVCSANKQESRLSASASKQMAMHSQEQDSWEET